MKRHSKKTMASYLRHRIDIIDKVEVPDNEGGFIQTWQIINTVWASVDPIRENQDSLYRSINADTTHIIKVRGNITILDTYMIIFDNREFEILSFANVQEREVVNVILCKEIKRK